MLSYALTSTRFNSATYAENMEYRLKYGGVAYGTSVPMKPLFRQGRWNMFVVEMNNSTNQIEGIGVISNHVQPASPAIYTDPVYNLYKYKGEQWASREDLVNFNEDIVNQLESMLFLSISNQKRLSGITEITDKIFLRWGYSKEHMMTNLCTLFGLPPPDDAEPEEVDSPHRGQKRRRVTRVPDPEPQEQPPRAPLPETDTEPDDDDDARPVP